MKKVIIPSLLVAMSLVFLSFKPMTKKVDAYTKAPKTTKPAVRGGTCTEFYKTIDTQSACFTVYVETRSSNPDQASILNKY